jgi:hypothetical protein
VKDVNIAMTGIEQQLAVVITYDPVPTSAVNCELADEIALEINDAQQWGVVEEPPGSDCIPFLDDGTPESAEEILRSIDLPLEQRYVYLACARSWQALSPANRAAFETIAGRDQSDVSMILIVNELDDLPDFEGWNHEPSIIAR